MPQSLNSLQKKNRRPVWKEVSENSSSTDHPVWAAEVPQSDSINAPIDYFRKYFDSLLIEHIVYQSNLYAAQENPDRPLQLTCNELEKYFAVIMLMSIISLSCSRLYWSLDLAISQVSKIMSRTRFEQIKRFIHFNDNSSMPESGDPNFDKLFKVRPLLDHLRQKFNAVQMDQMLCIDEQMIPFKGHSSLKQYIPSKPHKYGYKVFMLCSNKGVIHDFELYSGKILPSDETVDLGASSNIVLRLAKAIPTQKNFLLYFDNWFTSLPLVCHLAKIKIFCLGTVRANRLQGCHLPLDKEMKKKGRGYYIEKECCVDGVTVRVVKWLDTKGVTFLTSFESAQPVSSVQRFDRSAKKNIDVSCPKIVSTYNKFMGGVDLLDSLISLYRIKLRSKKYYHRLFFHFVDMVTVNCWLLYRRDCDNFGFPKSQQLSLLKFKYAVADALYKQGKEIATAKRGRPSSSTVEIEYLEKRSRGHNSKPIPQQSIRKDNIDHFPIYKEKRARCKLPGCKSCPHFYCQKCNVYLCIDKHKNCFLSFHKD